MTLAAGILAALPFGPASRLVADPGTGPGERPNIVIILCDDLGYGDVGCYNPQGKIATPSFDRIAAGGMRFTDAHTSSAVCTPSRYSLLTGRYNWRSRLQSGVLGGLSPRLIEPGRETLASFLRGRGYQTACFGKWHLGMNWAMKPGGVVNELNIESQQQHRSVDYALPFRDGPTSLGFDRYFGISASLDMVPYTWLEQDHVLVDPSETRGFPMRSPDDQGLSRVGPAAPGFEAVDVLPELARRTAEYIHQAAPAAKGGKPFFIYVPLASPHTPIAPTKEWRGRSSLNSYADFVMQTDAAIGQILQALANNGLERDTLVIATSDNGCSPMADYDALKALGHDPSAGLRGHKADIYEGGHRVPFLVRWPARIKAGSRSDALVCLMDCFATVAEILGARLPDDAAEDSVSFLSAALGRSSSPRDHLVHHSINGSFAIRQGPWKLALCPGSGGWSFPRPGRDDTTRMPRVQLFNLSDDPDESDNVQSREAARVGELTARLEKLVADGRSTAGVRQANTVPVDIWKAADTGRKQGSPKKKAAPVPPQPKAKSTTAVHPAGMPIDGLLGED